MRRGVWAGAAVVVLALAGCASPGDLIAEKVIEQGMSQNGTKVDIDADGDGGVTMEFEDGTEYQVGDHAKIPDDFPSELPLPDGQLLGVVNSDGGVMLQYKVAGRVPFDDLVAKLQAAGFEDGGSIDMEGLVSMNLVSDDWTITLGVAGDDDERTMTYGVYPSPE